jgi:hypothetical protein
MSRTQTERIATKSKIEEPLTPWTAFHRQQYGAYEPQDAKQIGLEIAHSGWIKWQMIVRCNVKEWGAKRKNLIWS